MPPSKRKIAFVSDATLQAGDKREALRLPHPRGVDEVLFARRGARLLELQRKTASFGAWFVDDGVVSETGVVLATHSRAVLVVDGDHLTVGAHLVGCARHGMRAVLASRNQPSRYSDAVRAYVGEAVT